MLDINKDYAEEIEPEVAEDIEDGVIETDGPIVEVLEGNAFWLNAFLRYYPMTGFYYLYIGDEELGALYDEESYGWMYMGTIEELDTQCFIQFVLNFCSQFNINTDTDKETVDYVIKYLQYLEHYCSSPSLFAEDYDSIIDDIDNYSRNRGIKNYLNSELNK